MIRPAKDTDVLAIIGLIEAAHKRSIYADVDVVDRDFTRQMFTRSLTCTENSGAGGVLFLVSENDGKIEGYFFGFLHRLYEIGKKLAATDVHFYLSPDADPRDALKIVNAFIEWGVKNPKVVEIRIGESNVMGEPDPRFAELLKRKGFEAGATVFTKRTSLLKEA